MNHRRTLPLRVRKELSGKGVPQMARTKPKSSAWLPDGQREETLAVRASSPTTGGKTQGFFLH